MSKIMKTLRRFYQIVWGYKRSFFLLYLVDIIVQSALPFVNIIFPKFIIDELTGQQRISKIVLYVGLTIGLNFSGNCIKAFLRETKGKYSDDCDKYFSRVLSQKAMHMDFQYTEDPKVLEQLEKAKLGLDWYSGGVSGMTDSLCTALINCITMIGAGIILASGMPWLFLVLGISIVLDALINRVLIKISLESYQNMAGLNRCFAYIFWELMDLRFAKDIRLYGAEHMMEQKATYYNDNMSKVWENQAKRERVYGLQSVLLKGIRNGLVVFFIAWRAIRGLITLGDFSMYMQSSTTFYDCVREMVKGYQELYKKVCYGEEFVNYMDYPDALEKGKHPVAKDQNHVFEFVNVSFAYPGTSNLVLKNVSVKLSPGEHISVVGLNGAGKTTFIKLLCRLYDPTKGKILLDGIDIKEYDIKQYLELISVVFQDFQLFAFPLAENILLHDITKQKLDEEESAHLKEVIEKTDLTEVVDNLPKKENTYIFKQFDEGGIELSGGQQQKLSIARALYKDSPMVILDEPTAALDPIAEYEIYRQFNHLVGGKTAVYISHRLSSCRFCDSIYVFDQGEIKEHGTHEQLISLTEGIYAKMFKAQAQYYQ